MGFSKSVIVGEEDSKLTVGGEMATLNKMAGGGSETVLASGLTKEEVEASLNNNNSMCTPNMQELFLEAKPQGLDGMNETPGGVRGGAMAAAGNIVGGDMKTGCESGVQGGIASFYDGATVLVTGGTGFVGKALLEKLLRSCPGIEVVYVLMRPKRGLTVEQRYKELVKNPVFDRVRARWPARLGKLVAMSGDVSAAHLGLCERDRQLLREVTLVLHSAATVRFTEPLHAAVTLNVLGTRRLLELCKTMPGLKAMVHVSTAYSNAPRTEVEERVYPPPYDPDTLVTCATTLPAETMELIAERLQGDHPNTYTMTKAMAESVVMQYSKELPICIVRPSIVTAAHQEPFPGWIDNVYGVTGIVMEISRGTYRSGYCREKLIVDMVPVDIVVNTCIAAAWRQAQPGTDRCPVYNCTSGSVNPMAWGDFTRYCVKWARENPTKYVMMYPNFGFTESRLVNTFWETFAHLLPAFVYDLLLRAQGRKPIMMKVARRFQLAAVTGEYFANHEWHFRVDKLLQLRDASLAAPDGKAFPQDVGAFEWEAYVGAYMMGIRKFVLKDMPESLPAARVKLNRLYWAYRLFQAVSGYYLFRLFAPRRL